MLSPGMVDELTIQLRFNLIERYLDERMRGWWPRQKPKRWASAAPPSWLARREYPGAPFELGRGNSRNGPVSARLPAGGSGAPEEGGKGRSRRIRLCRETWRG
jgi:hypothetical protein